MSGLAVIDPVPSVAGQTASGPGRERGWVRANLFGSIGSSLLTVLLGAVLLWAVAAFLDWAVLRAVWSVPAGAGPGACNAAGAGACWAKVGVDFRLILFGLYPYDEQWRPAICVALFIGLYAISAMPRFWRWRLAWIWGGTLVVIGGLMWGGIAGLPFVSQDRWGGLPITLILATFGLALAFPLAIVVALGRRSTALPAVRMLCVGYVELIRGVPLVSLLFMAHVLFPLFVPASMTPDDLLRAQVAFILFAGAYLAEIVRAGLQAMPKGQYEAADALGLSYWRKTGLVILPQALRQVIPPLVNTFIGFFKDTSLVVVISIADLLYAGRLAINDKSWPGHATEIYLLLAVIYFLFCFAMSRASRRLEQSRPATR